MMLPDEKDGCSAVHDARSPDVQAFDVAKQKWTFTWTAPHMAGSCTQGWLTMSGAAQDFLQLRIFVDGNQVQMYTPRHHSGFGSGSRGHHILSFVPPPLLGETLKRVEFVADFRAYVQVEKDVPAVKLILRCEGSGRQEDIVKVTLRDETRLDITEQRLPLKTYYDCYEEFDVSLDLPIELRAKCIALKGFCLMSKESLGQQPFFEDMGLFRDNERVCNLASELDWSCGMPPEEFGIFFAPLAPNARASRAKNSLCIQPGNVWQIRITPCAKNRRAVLCVWTEANASDWIEAPRRAPSAGLLAQQEVLAQTAGETKTDPMDEMLETLVFYPVTREEANEFVHFHFNLSKRIADYRPLYRHVCEIRALCELLREGYIVRRMAKSLPGGVHIVQVAPAFASLEFKDKYPDFARRGFNNAILVKNNGCVRMFSK